MMSSSLGNIRQIFLTYFPQAGYSALILAAWWGRADIVMELVKAGAKLNLQDKVKLTTPTSQNHCLSLIIPTFST